MNKLKTIALTSIMFGLSVSTALADTYYDYARVLKVKPVYHYVTVSQPVQQCYPVERRTKVRKHHRHSAHRGDRSGSTVVGAVIGGALGNVLGKATGTNRNVSTIAGALIGGSIGRDSHRNRYDHCEVVYQKTEKVREVKGYNVKYRYEGESYRTFMRKHPGNKIKVRVRVSPAGYD